MTARHDQLACGTATTGTGVLTLAALPAAITAIDPFAAFSGNGWGTSQGVPVDYSIVEYTDSSFAKPMQAESGRGVLLLGANLAATTLTRTTPLQTATGMDSPPASVGGQSSAASAINIGTAANVVIWFCLSSFSPMGSMPYYTTGSLSGGDLLGFSPPAATSPFGSNFSLNNQQAQYQSAYLPFSGLIKSVSFARQAGYTGGTASTKAALYDIGSDGRPGKKLLDFGTTGSIASGTITMTASAAVFVPAGFYFFAILDQFSGGTGTPNFRAASTVMTSIWGTAFSGSQAGPIARGTVAGQTSLNDPATLTSLQLQIAFTEIALAFKGP